MDITKALMAYTTLGWRVEAPLIIFPRPLNTWKNPPKSAIHPLRKEKYEQYSDWKRTVKTSPTWHIVIRQCTSSNRNKFFHTTLSHPCSVWDETV